LLHALAAPRVLVKGVFFANNAELLLPSAVRGRRSAGEGVPFIKIYEACLQVRKEREL
jgi:hypothetical protein